MLLDGGPVTPVANGAGSSATPFTNVTANHTISATFAIDTFTITPTAGPTAPSARRLRRRVSYGATPTFTITPVTGYHIADVVVDGCSVGAVSSYTFPSVTANRTITATFAIDTFTITPTAGAQRLHHARPPRRASTTAPSDIHHHTRHRLPRRPGAR